MVSTPELRTAHVPQRTCVGCRRRRAQGELVRCTLGPAGPVVSRTAPGRGAWLCSSACLDTAIRRRAFDRAWRQPVTPDLLDALRNALGGVITNMTDSSTVGDRPATAVPTKG